MASVWLWSRRQYTTSSDRGYCVETKRLSLTKQNTCIFYQLKYYLLFSQRLPSQASEHMHEKLAPSPEFTHVPLFLQGLDEQGLGARRDNINCETVACKNELQQKSFPTKNSKKFFSTTLKNKHTQNNKQRLVMIQFRSKTIDLEFRPEWQKISIISRNPIICLLHRAPIWNSAGNGTGHCHLRK